MSYQLPWEHVNSIKGPLNFSFCNLARKLSKLVSYLFYSFVGEGPKFFNSSGQVSKSYPADLVLYQKKLFFTGNSSR